ncbi:MAG: hypothetical protein OXJ54_07415 [Gemmatimonadetes bacterium]|nr:hypothetical protein [Candidatus Palauibacter rhopaloidicola]
MSKVGYHDPTIGHDRHRRGSPELARPLPEAAELAEQLSAGRHNDDPTGEGIEYVEIPGCVECDLADMAELLPRLADCGPDAVDVLEVGVQPAVFPGKFDDLLGTGPLRRR